jgi:hypothetical protein
MKKLGLVLILALGCKATSEPAGPRVLSGNLFVLQSIAGETLPTEFYSGTPVLAYADTLALYDDGTGLRRSVVTDDTPWGSVAEDIPFHWMQSGSLYTITFDCPPAALCIQQASFSGTRANDSLTVTQSTTNRVPLIYQYVDLLPRD